MRCDNMAWAPSQVPYRAGGRASSATGWGVWPEPVYHNTKFGCLLRHPLPWARVGAGPEKVRGGPTRDPAVTPLRAPIWGRRAGGYGNTAPEPVFHNTKFGCLLRHPRCRAYAGPVTGTRLLGPCWLAVPNGGHERARLSRLLWGGRFFSILSRGLL
jgi:hypothetical protein